MIQELLLVAAFVFTIVWMVVTLSLLWDLFPSAHVVIASGALALAAWIAVWLSNRMENV